MARDVIAVTDRFIAHITDQPRPSVTFADLDAVIDHLEDMFEHCAKLITHIHYLLSPVLQYDGRATFSLPHFDQNPSS